MKELIEKILVYLPQYLMDFGSLVAEPKQFMIEKNTQTDTAFTQALIFLGVSIVLVVIMTTPLLPPEKDLWTYLAANAVIYLLFVSLNAVALRIAWRAVGGTTSIRSFFVVSSYFFGVIIIGVTVVILISEGAFKVLDYDLYMKARSAVQSKGPMPDMSGSSIPLVSLSITAVGYIIVSIWSFITWGSYRQLNGLSRWRSFFAAIISGTLGLPLTVGMLFIGSAMLK